MAAGMMMLGMGGLQMLSGMEANAQQRAMEQAQHAIRLSNYNREKMVGSLQNMMKNIEISRINQARWRQNREIARAANMNRVLQEGELRRSVGGKLMQISRGQSQALDTLTSKVAGSGMTPESGTARALRKMIQNASGQEMQNLKRNDYVSRQNIIREQDKALASRDLHGYKQGSTYFSGPAPQLVQTAKTSPLQAATMFAGGAAQGMSMAGDLNALNSGTPDSFAWGDLW
jgi:hypothetical protein